MQTVIFPLLIGKGNCKVYLYSATIAAYAASVALCVTGRAGIQPRSQFKPVVMDYGL